MGKPTGFMEYQRTTKPKRDAKARIDDWRELYHPLTEDQLRQQGARCMDCAVPFCQTGVSAIGCPIHNLIPEWNDLVYQGQWRQALDRLHETNNFPEFTGRACPAPCEGSCVAGLYDSPVAIKTIEQAIIDKGFEEGWVTPHPPKKRTGFNVAIIGSGPAGLAAADQLNKKGHTVTVFERDDRVGGLLTYGIPKTKIEQNVVDRRINLLREEGIQFVTGVEVGRDMTMAELNEQFDSVILCTGATKPRDLPVEGRQLQGIHFAMEFLHKNTKSLLDSNHKDGNYISAKGKDVVVIGGGDTATDCISTAIRHGCRSLVQFDIYPKKSKERDVDNPWPLYPIVHQVDTGHEEAKAVFGQDPRAYAVSTTSFIGDENGYVSGVKSVEVIYEKNEDGTKKRIPLTDREQLWPAQLVLLAIGFEGPEQEVLANLGVETTERSWIATRGYETNIPGVFAAGDARRGQSLIVWAIREGREAAEACHRYLQKLQR